MKQLILIILLSQSNFVFADLREIQSVALSFLISCIDTEQSSRGISIHHGRALNENNEDIGDCRKVANDLVITDIVKNTWPDIFRPGVNPVVNKVAEYNNFTEFSFNCDYQGLLNSIPQTPESVLEIPKIEEDLSNCDFYVRSYLVNGAIGSKEKINFLNTKKSLDVDVVSRILNYSSGCNENGCEDKTWFVYDSKTCSYKSISKDGKIQELALNNLDLKNLKIINDKQPLVLYEEKVMFEGGKNEYNKILKGWEMIYKKYCTGRVS